MKHYVQATLLSVATVLFTSGFAFALDVGQTAPCVVLDQTQNGVDSTHCIRDTQVEGRPVLIEFFSITCSDCMKNLPNIKQLAKRLQGQATVRFVSIDRDEAKVRAYIAKNQIDIEVAFDTNRDARKAYGVSVTPTLFLLDQENTIQNKHTGVLSTDDINEIITQVQGL
jgi:thiol-disulfide isomerase/thioredoxin